MLFFRSIQMSWMQSSQGWVCLFVKKVLPEAVFLGKEREKSLTVHLVSITTAVRFSSPVALCVSFCMSKKDTKTIVHFWEICFHLIFWTHSKYNFRLLQHCLYKVLQMPLHSERNILKIKTTYYVAVSKIWSLVFSNLTKATL